MIVSPGSGTMDEVTTYLQEHSKNLLELQQTGYLCDTVLVAEDGQLKAHSIVLAAASPLFKASLQSDDTDALQKHIIVLPGICLTTAQVVVEYVYTGAIVLPRQNQSECSFSTIVHALVDLGLKPEGYHQAIETTKDCDGMAAVDQNSTESPTVTDCEIMALNTVPVADVESVSAKWKPRVTKKRLRVKRKAITGSSVLAETCVIGDNGLGVEFGDRGNALILLGSTDSLDSFQLCTDTDTATVGNEETLDFICNSSELSKDDFADLSDRTSPEKMLEGTEAQPGKRKKIAARLSQQIKTEGGFRKRNKFTHSQNTVCELCGKVVTFRCIQSHMRTHTREKPFSCRICGLQFSVDGNLTRHMKVHSGDRQHICELCGLAFIQPNSLVDHRWSHHRDTIDVEKDEAPFRCRTCGEKFFCSRHQRFHVCGEAAKSSMSAKKTQAMLRRKRQRLYKCPDCPLEFPQLSVLVEHARTAHNCDKPFTCDICDMRFRLKSYLLSHQNQHGDVHGYRCVICNTMLRTRSELIEHRRQQHYSLKCAFCSKTFYARQELTVHEHLHTGAKPYKCDVCGREFRQRTHLRTHMINIHIGCRRYGCDHCDKMYKNLVDLRVHCLHIHGFELPKRRASRHDDHDAKELVHGIEKPDEMVDLNTGTTATSLIVSVDK